MTALAEEIANYYPDSQVRKRILNVLAESIVLADEGLDGCWSLTIKDGKSIRLTVGSIACFRAGALSEKELSDLDPADVTNWAAEQSFWLTISTAPGEMSEESERLVNALKPKPFVFKRPSDAISIRIPVAEMDEFLPHFLPAHHAVIERLRDRRSHTGDSFSAEAFEYIERESGRDLPVSPHSKSAPGLSAKLEKSFMAIDPLFPDQVDETDRMRSGKIEPPLADWRPVFKRLFTNEGLHYTSWQQAVFFTALQTKGFVILSGISGTGKTKIAQAFSAALPQPDDGRNVEFLTVRPDWRDSKSLLGYHNPITDRYEWTPFLRFLLRASESWEARDGLAWFVILDEMNLAHVEHYFAELLSVLESGRDDEGWTRETIHLPSSGAEGSPPASLKLPPNLQIIGTVNLDETTHAFSPKVLDRAFAMELSDVSFAGFPFATANGESLSENERDALLDAFSVEGAFPRIDQAAISARLLVDGRPRDWLESLNRQLRPYHMHFGYRVFDEIMAFVDLGIKNQLFKEYQPEGDQLFITFDAAVQMKVLPKFHGSRARLEGPLTKVLGWCLNPDYPTQTIDNAFNQAASPDALEVKLLDLPYRFPETAKRAIRLLWTAQVDGFAAFG